MKFTHPKFKEFIKCLYQCSVDYMLVGGYAVILHGYVRGTGDMDVWLNPTEDNRQKLKLALLKFGYGEEDLKVLDKGNPVDALRGQIEIESFHIDLITMVSRLTFEEAISKSRKFTIENTEVNVINFEELILTKMFTDRLRDKDDVEQLFKLRKK